MSPGLAGNSAGEIILIGQNLKSIDDDICFATNIHTLNLDMNYITSINPNITLLTSIQVLTLTNNLLTTFDDCICDLITLK